MKIYTFPTPKEINHDIIIGKTIVLVDILRFSTTILTAFKHKAKVCLPVKNTEQAMSLYESIGAEEAILCGERKGQKIEGFHLGNSPFEYQTDIIENKTLIFTTTNGTEALVKLTGATNVLIGGFNNLSHLKSYLTNYEEIYILCAGHNGRFALEDFLFCGALAQELKPESIDDATSAAVDLYNSTEDLTKRLKQCDHGRNLIEIGFKKDIEYAAKLNIVDVILKYHDGRIIKIQD